MSERETQVLVDLLVKYQRNELSETERSLLQAWIKEPGNEKIFKRLTNDELFGKELRERHLLKELILQTINDRIAEADFQESSGKASDSPLYRKMVYWKWIAAAAILFCTLTVVYLQIHHKKAITNTGQTIVSSDILAPVGSRAILTLSDGSHIVLDSVQTGTVAHQGSTNVSKLANGQISYHVLQGQPSGDLTYNTLSTSRGGQTALVLSDGTKVWLNASSSIKYPTSFSGTNRTVQMTGEGYFEVAKNAAKPFKVKTINDAEIEVLGTNFNVMAYPDEPALRATLLKGSIKISKGTENALLVPGQQAEVTGKIAVKTADVDEAVSWKNGLFEFNSANIETVMRAIGRWYDVDIRYEVQKDRNTFTGQVSRASNASEALKILATSGYHFKIEGKIITVLP